MEEEVEVDCSPLDEDVEVGRIRDPIARVIKTPDELFSSLERIETGRLIADFENADLGDLDASGIDIENFEFDIKWSERESFSVDFEGEV